MKNSTLVPNMHRLEQYDIISTWYQLRTMWRSSQLWGENTLLRPYMDVTLVVFHVFLIYNKINKVKIFRISIKGLTYVKLTFSKNAK
jgi:hypothetical protein